MARRRKKREAEEPIFAEGEAQEQERARLTPVDVQQKVFRLAFRGYNEGDVDEFLDQITESLAALHEENKRLLEQLQEAGAGGSAAAVAAAQRQAEAIVSGAREQAARITEEGGGAPVVAGSAPTSFLVRERAFLQRIASLVQDHARALKQEARRTRETSTPEATAPAGDVGASSVAAAGIGAGAGIPAGSPPESGSQEAEAAASPEGPEDEAASESPSATTEASGEGEASSAAESVETVGPVAPGQTGDPGDVTAPWRPVNAPETEVGSPQGEPTDEDPLVAAWESAFVSSPEGGAGPQGSSGGESGRESRRDSNEDEEPSLRELFWGEE
jgi:DivIVA domain-containing protein